MFAPELHNLDNSERLVFCPTRVCTFGRGGGSKLHCADSDDSLEAGLPGSDLGRSW